MSTQILFGLKTKIFLQEVQGISQIDEKQDKIQNGQ